MAERLKIEKLGAGGDGIARNSSGELVYIPFSLEGEEILTKGNGARRVVSELLTQSPDRAPPICRHFGVCGGCQLQHFEPAAYQAWKRNLLVAALQREGIETDVDPLAEFEVSSRRRAVFSARLTQKGTMFGFQERNTNTIINIEECPVLLPAIADLLGGIKQAVTPLLTNKATARISVLSAANGIDVSVESERLPSPDQVTQASLAFAQTSLLRLTCNGEIVLEREAPILSFGGFHAFADARLFVQALAEAETLMADLVVDHLKSCKTAADLFCGIGTFTLRLAKTAPVLAIEGDKEALHLLDRSWRASGGQLKQIKCAVRDLFRQPLMADQMKRIEGVVFDPPRAGAEAQAREIAASSVSRVVAVSCNPVTLARDLAILLAGGFAIEKVVPIDQFRFTPHLESVVLLSR